MKNANGPSRNSGTRALQDIDESSTFEFHMKAKRAASKLEVESLECGAAVRTCRLHDAVRRRIPAWKGILSPPPMR